jgi:hypothetical protein
MDFFSPSREFSKKIGKIYSMRILVEEVKKGISGIGLASASHKKLTQEFVNKLFFTSEKEKGSGFRLDCNKPFLEKIKQRLR